MDRNMSAAQIFFERTLKRTGGYFLLAAVFAAQVVTNIFIAPTTAMIQFNAALTDEQLSSSIRLTLMLVLANNLFLLGLIYSLHRNAFQRLQAWKEKGTLSVENNQERMAWREITSLPSRYGVLAIVSSFIVVILPLILYQYFILNLNTDQLGYTFLGGFVSVLVIVLASAVGLDLILQPARQVLLPYAFEDQVKYLSGVNIRNKLIVLMIALVISGIAIIAPVGYREIVDVTLGVEAEEALTEYQVQSILISGLVILIGAALAGMLGRSISSPFGQLVDVFRKVEQGDLAQRVRITASDEGGELEMYFNRMIARLETLQYSLEEQVAEQTAQLAAVNEVGRAVSAILDPDELIERVVNLITDRFGHYYAALFLLDPSEKWAEIRSATGEAGRVLKESRHRLEVGGKSMVGSAVSQRTARIALDVGAESVRFDNPLLPYTRSEIALPLIVGDRALGALDVQSTKPSAFGPQDIETLQNMANQVAVAIENARLFQETRLRLLEIQAAQRQYLQSSWSSLATQEQLEYGLGEDDSGAAHVEVPLALRDQVIGQITLTGDSEWTPEDRAWIEAVATQAAIALENARLMDESRAQATVERTVTEITKKIWSANTIEGILRTAAKEIGVALDASEATIDLAADMDEREKE